MIEHVGLDDNGRSYFAQKAGRIDVIEIAPLHAGQARKFAQSSPLSALRIAASSAVGSKRGRRGSARSAAMGLPSWVSFTALPACRSRSAARVILDASMVAIGGIIAPARLSGDFEDLPCPAVIASLRSRSAYRYHFRNATRVSSTSSGFSAIILCLLPSITTTCAPLIDLAKSRAARERANGGWKTLAHQMRMIPGRGASVA